jgi:hypothetical protein
MTDHTGAPEVAGRVVEREWSDEFGDHYEARAIGRDGKLYSQHVMRYRYGWGHERGEAYENVRRAAQFGFPAATDKPR